MYEKTYVVNYFPAPGSKEMSDQFSANFDYTTILKDAEDRASRITADAYY